MKQGGEDCHGDNADSCEEESDYERSISPSRDHE